MTTFVNCPTCDKKVEWSEQNKYRPFCSERCKQIDLGAWAAEKYTIPGKTGEGLPDDPEHKDLN
ncbi:DNA gyrase inhibitor YacG [Pararobbsia alpina]|uniref:DNA gyrase inhibitor YacG n=1 Tax=Pararobbsia alpina TaxID=621374 RepID=UPI0039A458AA